MTSTRFCAEVLKDHIPWAAQGLSQCTVHVPLKQDLCADLQLLVCAVIQSFSLPSWGKYILHCTKLVQETQTDMQSCRLDTHTHTAHVRGHQHTQGQLLYAWHSADLAVCVYDLARGEQMSWQAAERQMGLRCAACKAQFAMPPATSLSCYPILNSKP